MIQIEISRGELFAEMARVCYLVGGDPELAPEMSARIADILEPANAAIVSRAVGHAFDEAAYHLCAAFGAAAPAALQPDAGDATRYVLQLTRPDGWTPAATERLRNDLFRYLADCGLACWFGLLGLGYATARRQAAADALSRLRSQAAAARPARIIPRPF